jgi:hypothetical protein
MVDALKTDNHMSFLELISRISEDFLLYMVQFSSVRVQNRERAIVVLGKSGYGFLLE